MDNLIKQYINDPNNSETNYALALHYDSIGQTASALSYYLRAAERTDDKLLAYECLIRGAECYMRQGTRRFTVKCMLQNAITLLPKRPEAYLKLSQIYENASSNDNTWTWAPCWFEAYTTASIALELCDFSSPSLRTDVGFRGKYQLLFQKAHTAWHCGLCDYSREAHIDLYQNYDMDELYYSCTVNNIKSLGINIKDLQPNFNVYDKSKLSKIRFRFDGIEKIEKNYAEAYQDMFVLSVLNGKRKGTYLEIGSARPFYGNNTALLEKDFEWSGVGYDLDSNFVDSYNLQRKNKSILQDARTIDFSSFENEIDYLQIDCDPPEVSYEVLTKIPLDKIKFNVITFEHDYYNDSEKKYRDLSRNYLESKGYILVVANVSPDDDRPYEDWWVHSSLKDSVQHLIDTSDKTKNAEKYFFEQKPNLNEKWKFSVAPTMEFTTIIPEKGCVVDCVFCPQRTLSKVYKGERRLSLDNFKRVVDKIPQEVRISFAGFTEPWLNSDCTEMLLYAHEKGHPISAFTTLVGMQPKDIEAIRHVPFAGNPNGGFTVHLPDQERLAKHPINDNYIETVKYLHSVQHEIQDLRFMSMGPVHESIREWFSDAFIPEMWSRAGNLVGEGILKQELQQHYFKSVNHGEKDMTCGCDERLYHNVMLPNGDVALCCMDYGLEEITGNLFEQEYNDVLPEPYECFKMCRLCENAVDVNSRFIQAERKMYGV